MRLTVWLAFLPAVACVAATEERIHKSFPVEPGGKLVVNVEFGEIAVSTHEAGEVVVDVWRQVTRKDKADEEAFLQDAPVKFAQQGETVTVASHRKERIGWSNRWSGFRNRTEGKYTIQVPVQCNVQLDTAGGSISVTELTGEVKADTSGGELRFIRVRGPIQGDTSGGSIHVSDCDSKIEIKTSGGGITVTGGGGSLAADTSGGAITVKEFAGPARVETSGGGITLERVGGKLDGRTSGGPINATLLSPLPGEVRLSTSGGSVTVRAPGNASFQLDAATSAGGVSCDLPIAIDGKKQHGRLRGTVNGGGQTIHLRSSGGSIQVKKR